MAIDQRLPVYLEHQRPADREKCISGTPTTGSRADRLSGRCQCTAFACPNNLLVEHSEDMPGKPHDGVRPDWTFRGDTTASSPSCVNDITTTGAKTSKETAEILGITQRRVQQIEEQLRDVTVDLAALREFFGG